VALGRAHNWVRARAAPFRQRHAPRGARTHEPEKNDFLRRFLDRNGPGPHHLTFKVKDISGALAAAEEAGYHPVGIDLRDPTWKEAFLHPKEATGVVIQLAQSAGDWKSPPPHDLPSPRTQQPSDLLHVAHGVTSLDDGLGLFRDLLGGREIGRGDGPGGAWVELAWPGPGRVRLVERDRNGVAHLAFATESPGEVPDAQAAGEGAFEIAPERNLGTRLVLRPVGYARRHGRQSG
jgi:catechol 2,3-dioxygenase-like lactoylglutathione lyase family enzyme